MVQIIDSKTLIKKIKENIKKEINKLSVKPGLAIIIVGNDLASKIYVAAKEKACQEIGFYFLKIVLSANVTEDEVINKIDELNQNKKIHGILVQLPLPEKFNQNKIIQTINPEKDVDCLHPINFGHLMMLDSEDNLSHILIPCTPKGIIKLIESTKQSLVGKKAIIIGRSNIVGKPTALLLLTKDVTVTVCHSKTENLKEETKKADILISCVGKPNFITVDMVKKKTIIIDVGINRVGDKIVGDVDFENVKKVASFITPVPGGVGPMTIACLLENTLLLAQQKLN